MSNNKQTAVEWLVEEIDMQYPEINIRRKEWMVDKAKEMHKQEIIDAYHTNPLEAKWQNKGFQYYNETFGGNNEQ